MTGRRITIRHRLVNGFGHTLGTSTLRWPRDASGPDRSFPPVQHGVSGRKLQRKAARGRL